MRWQCALLQRWLPEYPDGDLPAFWQARLVSHLEHCPACRRELAALREVVENLRAAPVTDPAPEFWEAFSREMHLKLVHAAQSPQSVPAPPSPRRFKIRYVLAAPALAVLALWLATNLSDPGRPVLNQVQMGREAATQPAQSEPKLAAVPKPGMAPAPREVHQPPALVALEVNGFTQEPEEDLDISGWDLERELAGMTEQEKEIFLKKMDQRKEDGSCIIKCSAIS